MIKKIAANVGIIAKRKNEFFIETILEFSYISLK